MNYVSSSTGVSAEQLKRLNEHVDEIRELLELANDYGFSDFLEFDVSIVRGLGYYTGIVFECFDTQYGLRAICGGGRYDKLMELYGSPVKIPCVGFGFGDCIIRELMEEMKIMPDLKPHVQFVVAPFNQSMLKPALKVASLLRQGGFNVNLLTSFKNCKKIFIHVDKLNANYFAYVAPAEWAMNKIRIKDMYSPRDNSLEFDVPMNELCNFDPNQCVPVTKKSKKKLKKKSQKKSKKKSQKTSIKTTTITAKDLKDGREFAEFAEFVSGNGVDGPTAKAIQIARNQGLGKMFEYMDNEKK